MPICNNLHMTAGDLIISLQLRWLVEPQEVNMEICYNDCSGIHFRETGFVWFVLFFPKQTHAS